MEVQANACVEITTLNHSFGKQQGDIEALHPKKGNCETTKAFLGYGQPNHKEYMGFPRNTYV
eukprot:10144869-Karenia_brevis.AAC.1